MATFIFDIGKTNIKGLVLGEHGETLWSQHCKNTSEETGPYRHINVDRIWLWLLETLKSAAQDFQISAINISTHGACAALVNQDGSLALPVMDYEFPGLNSENAGYSSVRPPFSQTLSPKLDAGLNLGRQLWWQKAQYPQAFEDARLLLLYPQYWAWCLTGVATSERTSLGCHTDLWYPQADCFSTLVDDLGLAKKLPPLVDNREPIGHVTQEIAEQVGLPTDCQVFPGVHDSNASLASHLKSFDGQPFTVISSGTWVVALSPGASIDALEEARDTLANVSVEGKPVACARYMGGREFEIICTTLGAEVDSIISQADLQKLITERQFAVPSFVAGCGPVPSNQPELPTSPCNGKALATLYTALMIDLELDLLKAQGPVVFGSSGDKNPLIPQLVAELRQNNPVLTSTQAAGTVQGAWLLTRWHQPPIEPVQYQTAKPLKLMGLAEYKHLWRQRLA